MIVQIVDARPSMPSGLEYLVSSAESEGIKNVSRLIQEWKLRQTLFDGTGECLFVAQTNGSSVGIGGILKCKVVSGALRVSRFYVLPEWRRKGVARAIANESLAHAREFTAVITCNAQATQNAAPFWESLGFIQTKISGITHALTTSSL